MFSAENPYYFNNNNKSPKTPESSSKGFSFFRRKSSKSNSNSNSQQSIISSSTVQCNRSINSATLGHDANTSLGSPRGSFGSLGSYPQVFEFQNGNQTIYRQSSIKDKYRERLGSYNESSFANHHHHHIHNDNIDDVFLLQTRTNGCNTLPINSDGNRRHSIGNFTHRQRCASLSDEVPRMIAPKPPVISPIKYRPNKRKDFCPEGASMDDILILTAKNSERAFTWASFLRARFDKITKQRGRKPFNFLHLKIDDGYFSTDLVKKCQTTALQILIFCPAVLALPQQQLITQFSSILNHDKVLAVLLEVEEKKLLEIHKTALPYYKTWKKCYIYQNDQSAIGNILGVATDILGRALCHRPPCHEINGPIKTPSEAFTVVPKKVRIGQNKILALLNEPLSVDDYIRITIDKSGEMIEIKNFKQRNPFTIQFNIPEICMEISTMIEVQIEKSGKNLGSRPVKCESRLREMELLLRTQDNPIEFMCTSLGIGATDRTGLDDHLLKCFHKNMPPNFHLLVGPSEKQLFAMKDKHPEEFPTLLHFAAKYGLEQLSMQLLECPGGDSACEVRNYIGKTPSDIAEQEGFQKLANSLKSFSQMHEFSTMYHYFKGITDSSNESKVVIDTRNFDNFYNIKTSSLPKHFDKKFSSNQKVLKPNNSTKTQLEYMEMSSGSENEKTEMKSVAVANLNYIKVENSDDKTVDEIDGALDRINLSNNSSSNEITNELKINEPPYYQSNERNNKNNCNGNESRSGSADQFSQECSNVLENCSISSQSEYLLQPSNVPINLNGDYLTQPSNRPVNELVTAFRSADHITSNGNSFTDSHVKMVFEKKKSSSTSSSGGGTLKRSHSDVSNNKGNVDDELAEIMNDFKNNVLSIKEVEQLVEKWKNRNDVKQSFIEKQEQIEKLREEYEKIQEKMKEKMKRPTPFERVKKLFSRSKSNHKIETNAISHHNQHDDLDETKLSVRSSQSSSQRPISSLSTQSVSSSSSSGRMSTGSACSGASLGDSGTHSDHDDRLRHQIFSSNCRIGSPGSLVENYLIPPPPRPVLTPISTSCDDKDRITFSTGFRSLNTPTSPMGVLNNSAEHYIIFPSNIPVFQENQTSSLNTIIEAKEMPNENHRHQIHQHNVAIPTPIKLKFLQEKNIIYGKLTKQNSKDLLTSFKSPTNPQPQNIIETQENEKTSVIIDVKKEMNEVYQNINSLTEEKENNNTKKCVQEGSSEFDEINLIRKNSCSSSSSNNNNSDSLNNTNNNSINSNNENDEHNYINI
ncbi:putative uncharacterized protein DDB_G0277255 isoform X2 [Condylostylus longicornis]|uniref:putative uncharacterized protein DDB_G0277255 isoform X2 n=1 Tax=Condylostylus longicornis TaxID=2530218 RepID=UPI00244E5B57|nr:putative uncharacterized protein DDB_G0277255 isoform X2 [Condylostylus longicornis]XP_055377383.1 putative uncharacterized protein DDB_G0277255 isoform X2 [Condylostylus longicornis]XP_055377384.1 putative uncharacterized protein DDB_G0277255 isoform X2 [Condylostylus longicornis]XP_055377385.1 putative uncharacterized protein DDB_G0277255 isoform X2 [Condylostylus longicornis]